VSNNALAIPPTRGTRPNIAVVDFHSGEVVFKVLTGPGWLFNNHYVSISIAPDWATYVGIMGELLRIKDGA
jgi:hypothetical protein